ncbi:MAG: TauD/TfdA family dioxygenase [Aquabacterium sp.]
MLQIKESIGPGIVKASMPDIWHTLKDRITEVCATFYEEPTPPGFYPHFNEVALRMTLLRQVPELHALQEQIRHLLKSDFCALVLDKLHLEAYAQPMRNRLLYALCTAIGFATPSSQHQATLLWDVRARAVPQGRDATYSEHSAEADLHTDSQSYPTPEEYFVLYTFHAARCGGGQSLFLGVDALTDWLQSRPEGREALKVLGTHTFPFFISAGEGTQTGGTVTTAPILGTQPAIRFRRDVIEKGFQAKPELDTPAARLAIATLLEAFQQCPALTTYSLPDDGIAICNNHRMLHGRTAFQDTDRHLVRVRMSHQPVAAHVMRMLQEHAAFAKALLA